MKIFREGKVYVQNIDIACLYDVDIKMPESISIELKKNLKINEKNKYNFLEFTNECEIEFFKNASWIIDYDEVKNLTDDKRNSFMEDVLIENICIKNYLEKKEKEENPDEEYLNKVYKLLEFKMNSTFMFFSFPLECCEDKLPKELRPRRTLKEKVLRKINFRLD